MLGHGRLYIYYRPTDVHGLANSALRAVVMQIIVGNTTYAEACCMLGLDGRRPELCRALYKQTVNNEFHSLYYLLPAKRDHQLISRLRSTTVIIQHFLRGQIDLNSLFLLPFLSNHQ